MTIPNGTSRVRSTASPRVVRDTVDAQPAWSRQVERDNGHSVIWISEAQLLDDFDHLAGMVVRSERPMTFVITCASSVDGAQLEASGDNRESSQLLHQLPFDEVITSHDPSSLHTSIDRCIAVGGTRAIVHCERSTPSSSRLTSPRGAGRLQTPGHDAVYRRDVQHDGPSAPDPSRELPSVSAGLKSRIDAMELSAEAREWVRQYAEVGHRQQYLWKWCRFAVDAITLPCVRDEWREHLSDTKFLAGMLNCLLDDLADDYHQPLLLAELLKLTRHGSPDLDRFVDGPRSYGEWTKEVWELFWSRTQAYPEEPTFSRLLGYDFLQLCNTVEYSDLLNHELRLMNVVEHDQYSAAGMMVMCCATLDLMCSPDFQTNDLGALREAVWHGQWMARIGNMLCTWERELEDRDFTSGVYAYAVSLGTLTHQDLITKEPEQIQQAIHHANIEGAFMDRWSDHRDCLAAMRSSIGSFDIQYYVDGLDLLLQSELASRGHK